MNAFASGRRASVWHALVAYVAATALVIVATTAVVVGLAYFRFRHDPAAVAAETSRLATSAPGIMVAALVSSAVLTIIALVGARLETRHIAARLRLGPTRASGAGLVAAVAALGGLTLASGAVIDLLGLRGSGNIGAIAKALSGLTPAQLAIAMVTIAGAPATAEEIFFRGFIQTAIAERWGRWPSILTAAFAFGLMHFDVAQGLAAFFAGLLLGWLVERFHGVRPSILAHGCNNAAFVALASFGAPDATTRAGQVAAIAGGLVALGGATALLASPFAIRRDASSLRA